MKPTTVKPLASRMGFSTPDKVIVKGYDLPSDLLGKIDLGAMAFLEICGRIPSQQEAEVFNALLITLVEHGLTPQAISSRLIFMGAPESLQGAVAAGLLGVGSVFAGGSEAVAKILQEALGPNVENPNFELLARNIVADHQQRKKFVPGLGHPLHKPVDPRTSALFSVAERNGFRGKYIMLFEEVQREAERCFRRHLPINATGAIGAILCELGLPWKICRGIAIISRTVGLVGHLAEEMQTPIAREIWERAEHEASEFVQKELVEKKRS